VEWSGHNLYRNIILELSEALKKTHKIYGKISRLWELPKHKARVLKHSTPTFNVILTTPHYKQ